MYFFGEDSWATGCGIEGTAGVTFNLLIPGTQAIQVTSLACPLPSLSLDGFYLVKM